MNISKSVKVTCECEGKVWSVDELLEHIQSKTGLPPVKDLLEYSKHHPDGSIEIAANEFIK